LDTLETLRAMLIEEFNLDPARVHPDTELTSLGIDSLSVIEFLFTLEDKFDIVLPDHRTVDGEAVKTLRDIATELDAHVAAQKGRSGPSASTS
jgi:acyl carrier protein